MRTLCTDGSLDLCTLLAAFLGVVVGGWRAHCVSFSTHGVPWLPLLISSSIPFDDAGWSYMLEILQHGDFKEHPWEWDVED